MTEYDLGKVVGDDGDDGNGIVSITKTGTSGKVDTYTILYDDGNSDTFTVTNGNDASVTIVTSWDSTTSDSKVPSEKLAKDSLDGKLDNALSSTAVSIASSDNILITDYSDSNKVKRAANILAGQVKDSTAHSNIGSSANDTQASINGSIDTALSNKISKSNTSGLVKNDGSIDTNTYSTFSGSYNDLSNKPTIPSKISDLTNDSDFIETSSTSGLVKNDGTIDTSAYITSSSLPTIQVSWGSPTSDSKVASEKLIKDSLDGKLGNSLSSTAVTIASNDNILITDYSDSDKIKRVSSILASQVKDGTAHANIGSSANDTQATINTDINTALGNKVSKSSTTGLLKNDGSVDTTQYLSSLPSHNHDDRYYTESEVDTALNGKQDTLVSGTNIKTINSQSLLGSGNISISGGGTNGEYFFSKDSFFDPNQWTGSPTISNGVITLSNDSYFPLRLPPNCVLTFDFTVTNGYDESISLLGVGLFEVNYDWLTSGVADINSTITNNYGIISSEATGDEVTVTNASSRYGLTIPITSGCTATISNVVFTDTNRGGGGGGSVDIVTAWESTPSDSKVASEKLVKDSLDSIEDLIGNAISYINGSGN